jgi:hypothetical protein
MARIGAPQSGQRPQADFQKMSIRKAMPAAYPAKTG